MTPAPVQTRSDAAGEAIVGGALWGLLFCLVLFFFLIPIIGPVGAWCLQARARRENRQLTDREREWVKVGWWCLPVGAAVAIICWTSTLIPAGGIGTSAPVVTPQYECTATACVQVN